MGLYLDYNATTPIDNNVLEYMVEIYTNNFGNADSRTHSYGSNAKKIVERAREQVAALLGAKRNEIIFTSGSTESNNIAILGIEQEGISKNKRHIITTAIEHKSILGPIRKLEKRGFEVDVIYPHLNGRIDAGQVLDKVREDTLLVSVMHVNNETGTIQPVEELGKQLKDKEVLFHVDASQSCGKLVDEIQRLQYDLLSISAHKMYGPQGVGAIVTRMKNGKRPSIEPIMFGGGQELGLRPGTLPVALIAGFGIACDNCLKNHINYKSGCLKNLKGLLQILSINGIKFSVKFYI
ncbi:aminotransferase class V-fold PLP-dependent enzyme [Dorea sp. D27]|uniref:aminotransferase class V-fold PLP-dependent enzyme n=1 Tax=Dorea sp. D27 TaxID=658665 RepID=UPI000673648E|nr:aminotransferase class V-fold PLP-dependent enzyme [Dorea sp. D27]KMZ53078.1 cysteine desulfurase [Dorea sp. D27]